MYDLVIRGGDLVDGTGATRRKGDIAISGGRIVALGSEQTVAESKGQENRVVYSLMRERGRWWVLSRLLRSSTEGP